MIRAYIASWTSYFDAVSGHTWIINPVGEYFKDTPGVSVHNVDVDRLFNGAPKKNTLLTLVKSNVVNLDAENVPALAIPPFAYDMKIADLKKPQRSKVESILVELGIDIAVLDQITTIGELIEVVATDQNLVHSLSFDGFESNPAEWA